MVRPTRRSPTSCSFRTHPSWRWSTSAWRSPRVTKRRKQTTVGRRAEGQTKWRTSTKERESSGNGRLAKFRWASWKSRRRGRTRRERRAGASQCPTRRLPPCPGGCGAVGGSPVTETGAPVFGAMDPALTTACASRNQARTASDSREGSPVVYSRCWTNPISPRPALRGNWSPCFAPYRPSPNHRLRRSHDCRLPPAAGRARGTALRIVACRATHSTWPR